MSLEEAAAVLHAHADDAKLLAGGQSLVPLLNFRLARPSVLVDLGRVPDLAYIREEGDTLLIGALTRQADIEVADLVRARLPLLGAAVEQIGHPGIRNRGTIGGSIAHADPAAELPCVLATLGGSVRARGRGGERTIGADEFFQGSLQTALRPDEIIVEVALPMPGAGHGWGFEEFSRRHGDFALAMVAVALRLGEAGEVASVSIGLGGVAPTPVRARQAEALLRGRVPSVALLREATIAIRLATDASDDIHATAEDRRHLAAVLGRRALERAIERARSAATISGDRAYLERLAGGRQAVGRRHDGGERDVREPGVTGYVGAALPRPEDRRFLLGAGRYVDDVELPGMLHAAFVRSPHAHARIASIQTSAARAVPGVVAVLTGQEICARAEPLRIAPPIPGLQPTEMEAFPTRKVRFVGDLVAMVVADSRSIAEDAGELVQVEYEPLPAVVDPARAGDPDQSRVDEALPSNVVYHGTFSSTADAKIDAAFASADEVLQARFRQHRQTHLPIETRGCVAEWDRGTQSLVLWNGTQAPHPMRTALAARLHLPEGRVRVISPDVGGAFGQKIPLYREELAVCVAARLLGRPVKWIEDRRENLAAACHAREDAVEVRAAVRRDGTLLGLEARILTDLGAYAFYPADYVARVVGMMLPGPYRLRHYRYAITSVLSTKCHAGPFRAPMLICSWVTEGLMDAIARHLRLDPVAVRQRNLIGSGELPYVSATGQRYEAVTPRETLETALGALDYPTFRTSQAEARAQGRLVGLGICTYLEPTVYGSAFYRAAGIAGSGHDAATVRIEPSGHVVAQVGIVSQGQGHATTIAQVLADELGVAPDDVTVLAGDTAAAPYGMGTRGSRGGAVSAGSVMGAAAQLRDKLLAIAGALLEAAPGDLELADHRIRVKGAPDRSVPLEQVARTAYLDPQALPVGVAPGLEAHHAYDPPPLTFANATHLCVVEVDRTTGAVRIPRYIVVEDCGTRLNPLIVEGQVHGGTALGIGGVLLEQVVYDEHGQNLTMSLMDYTPPTASDVPTFEVHDIETPNPHTPRGVKGMAEGGTMGGAAAVANAIADALAPLGIVVDTQPLNTRALLGLVRSAGALAEA